VEEEEIEIRRRRISSSVSPPRHNMIAESTGGGEGGGGGGRGGGGGATGLNQRERQRTVYTPRRKLLLVTGSWFGSEECVEGCRGGGGGDGVLTVYGMPTPPRCELLMCAWGKGGGCV
jgi:hypothetical protein